MHLISNCTGFCCCLGYWHQGSLVQSLFLLQLLNVLWQNSIILRCDIMLEENGFAPTEGLVLPMEQEGFYVHVTLFPLIWQLSPKAVPDFLHWLHHCRQLFFSNRVVCTTVAPGHAYYDQILTILESSLHTMTSDLKVPHYGMGSNRPWEMTPVLYKQN